MNKLSLLAIIAIVAIVPVALMAVGEISSAFAQNVTSSGNQTSQANMTAPMANMTSGASTMNQTK